MASTRDHCTFEETEPRNILIFIANCQITTFLRVPMCLSTNSKKKQKENYIHIKSCKMALPSTIYHDTIDNILIKRRRSVGGNKHNSAFVIMRY